MLDYIKNTKILIEKNSSWNIYHEGNCSVWFKGYIHNYSFTKLATECFKRDKNNINSWLKKLDGHFSLVVKTDSFIYAAVDKVRSCPIIWSVRDNGIFISDHGFLIEKELELGINDIELNTTMPFALSGYTAEESTLYKNVKQLSPGQNIWLTKENYQVNIF